jgi:hypothetical protein
MLDLMVELAGNRAIESAAISWVMDVGPQAPMSSSNQVRMAREWAGSSESAKGGTRWLGIRGHVATESVG